MAASVGTAESSDNNFFEQGRKLRELLGNVEARVTREEEKAVWDQVKDELESLVDQEKISETLLCEFDRKMDVLRDQRFHPGEVFKTFDIKDTTLNNILRLSPPLYVDNYIADNMPTYDASRNLYHTVNNTRLSDVSWRAFRKECALLRKPKDNEHRGYGLNQIEARQVFTIRHSDREDTILTTTVRMNPPLSAVTLLLKECRETLSFVDCPKWGWIPLQYAIQHQASPEVVSALIPSTEDIKQFSTFQQHDFLNKPDYRERTVLHWAGYYHAHLDTIKALRKACSEDVLKIKDHCKHLPYETAIWHGSSADIIEAFYVPGLDGHPHFDSVLVKLMRSLTDKTLKKSEGSSSVEEKELENETTHYTYCTYDLPSIAARIAKSSRLQKEVEERLVKTLPTFIRTADIIICVMMLVSYHFCADAFLQMGSTSDWIYPLTCAAVYITGREIADLRANNIDWFFSIWNYFDALTICLLIYSLCRMWVGDRDDELNEGFESLVVVTTIFIWTNALTLLRSTFISLGSFVNGILRIAQVLVPFLMVSLFVLLLFGEVFRLGSLNSGVCQQSSQNTTEFCTFGNSLYTTYGQFVGGIELEDYDESSLMKILSGVFGLIVGIILLNVVIAIVSDSWTGAVVESKEVFWHARMEFLMLSRLPTEESPLDKFLQGTDDLLSKICIPLWPSKDYWGVFDSFFDRMLSDDVGSFRWQIIFEIRTRLARGHSTKMIIFKAALLLAIFFTIASIWFVIGLFSIGILWPRPIRSFILSRSLPLENDLEEISNVSNENENEKS